MEKATTLSLPKVKVEIDLAKAKQAINIYKAISNPLRVKILELIDSKQPITVTEIYKKLNGGQSAISRELGILRKAGIVTSKRQGNFFYYSINSDYLNHIKTVTDNLLTH